MTLYELCKLPEKRRHTVRTGTAPTLSELAVALSAHVVKVLGLLAKNRKGRHDLSRISDIVPVLCSVAIGQEREDDEDIITSDLKAYFGEKDETTSRIEDQSDDPKTMTNMEMHVRPFIGDHDQLMAIVHDFCLPRWVLAATLLCLMVMDCLIAPLPAIEA
ncbi:hypothetical protein QYE76_052819 [Lolium multiflorum]|uniref:Uncharacterized protein n=1 Tax=Lolium multiflorum TaxID=4521 RepID=A0AAD8WLY1_LOLMU|nr:hypothetical protein QYE76_052819 [Lolium multiflorum]